MMLKIGLTGGIGSGKTTVANVFEILDIPVFYADKSAKELMVNNKELKQSIIKTFGKKAYKVGGELDREYLAELVFNHPGELKKLNKLVHPAVFIAFEQWAAKQSSPYVVKESALLFESGFDKHCNLTVLVQSPEELKIKRLIERDGLNPQEIKARMAKQMPDPEKLSLADYVLYNDEQQLLIPQIIKLHELFLQKAEEKI